MIERQLRIVRLLDPEMCLACTFCRIAEVEDAKGANSRMIQCRRLDCDNWDTSEAAPVRSVSALEEV